MSTTDGNPTGVLIAIVGVVALALVYYVFFYDEGFQPTVPEPTDYTVNFFTGWAGDGERRVRECEDPDQSELDKRVCGDKIAYASLYKDDWAKANAKCLLANQEERAHLECIDKAARKLFMEYTSLIRFRAAKWGPVLQELSLVDRRMDFLASRLAAFEESKASGDEIEAVKSEQAVLLAYLRRLERADVKVEDGEIRDRPDGFEAVLNP